MKHSRSLPIVAAIAALLVFEPGLFAQRSERSGQAVVHVQRGQNSRPSSQGRGSQQSRPAPSRPAPSRPAPSRPAPSRPAPSRPSSQRPAPSRPAPQATPPSRPAPQATPPSRPAPQAVPQSRPAPSRPAETRPAPARPVDVRPQPARPQATPPSARPQGESTRPSAAPRFDRSTYDRVPAGRPTTGESARDAGERYRDRGQPAQPGVEPRSAPRVDTRDRTRDGGYVRIDGDRGTTRRERPQAQPGLIDLSEARPARVPRTEVPSLSSSRRLRERIDAGSRFGPKDGEMPRPELDRLRDSRSFGPSTRARGVDNEAILRRYESPRRGADERQRPDGLRERAPARERITPDRERAAAALAERKRGSERPQSDVARRNLRELDRLPREESRKIAARSIAAARATDRALRTSVGVSLGLVGGHGRGVFHGGWNSDFAGRHGGASSWYWNCYWPSWSSWYWGGGYWCPWWGFGFRSRSFGFWYGHWYNDYWLYGSPYSSYWCPRPIWYSTVWLRDDPQVVVVEREVEVPAAEPVAPVGEAWVEPEQAPAAPAAPTPAQIDAEALSRAASHYLTVGDRAFRDGRYGDAVHFYAKAVEFSPDDGVLYLILSDALFATGDYHYGAYALRRAIELDATLVESPVDKHEFYGDPREFERQLAVLEQYLEEHFLDQDARLLLAANYLFGRRPAAAVDLLESTFSKSVRETPAGTTLLEAARAVQFGAPGLAPATPAAEDQ